MPAICSDRLEEGKDMFRLALSVIFAAMTMTPPSVAGAEDLATSAPGWDPSEFQLSKDGPCSFELARASVLLEMRDAGQSRERAAGELPKESGRSALVVASILKDIYENPQIVHSSYFVYRNVTCMRRHEGKPAPATLAAVAPQVVSCQSRFGLEITDQLISCIQHVVGGAATIE